MIHNLFTVDCAQMKRNQNFIITPALDHNLVLKCVQAEYIQLVQIQLLKNIIFGTVYYLQQYPKLALANLNLLQFKEKTHLC